MQTNQTQQPSPVSAPLSLRELTEVLIKHYGLHEGHYDLFMEFQVGIGGVAQQPESIPLPTAMISVSKLGLTKVPTITKSSVDAALINPKKMKRSPKEKEE
jgi:hypothetical protein